MCENHLFSGIYYFDFTCAAQIISPAKTESLPQGDLTEGIHPTVPPLILATTKQMNTVHIIFMNIIEGLANLRGTGAWRPFLL
jgi:hypothetical protein